MQVVPAGDNAVLIGLGEVTAGELHAAARAARSEPGVVAVVPGHSSLYVIRGEGVSELPPAPRAPRQHRIRVAFDGPDLHELLARIPRDEFLAHVAGLRLTARYLGFRGGFAYLDGWPDEWSMPRRATSRPVARGSFGVAGNVAGFYPIDTPGGWNILGRTDADLEHALAPEDEITIEVVDALPTAPRSSNRSAPLLLAHAELLSAPLATLVGPRVWANLERGLPAGGPFDEEAAACASSAVSGATQLLECAMTGPRLRFTRDAFAAWCGPDLELRTWRVKEGEELAIGRVTGGLRGYLAIGDRAGDAAVPERRRRSDVILAMRGPHDTGLNEIECEVTPHLDRVGIRLRPLRDAGIAIPADLRSSGMQCGTVQLHPDGSLVVMGPDHPVTGGYLQPMTVITTERWKLAQLVPGERVTLRAQPPSS